MKKPVKKAAKKPAAKKPAAKVAGATTHDARGLVVDRIPVGFGIIKGKLPTDSPTDPEDRVRAVDFGTRKVLWDGTHALHRALKEAFNSEGA